LIDRLPTPFPELLMLTRAFPPPLLEFTIDIDPPLLGDPLDTAGLFTGGFSVD
jgi:hypothetical protein